MQPTGRSAARPQFVNHSPRSYSSPSSLQQQQQQQQQHLQQQQQQQQQQQHLHQHPPYTSPRPPNRSLVSPRPLGDFAIDERPQIQRKRGPADMMIDNSSTGELARFLMNTAPPESGLRDDEIERRDSLVRRLGSMGFRKTKANKSIVDALPDAVKENITSSGRRYYTIMTDKYDGLYDDDHDDHIDPVAPIEPVVEIYPSTPTPMGVTDSSSEYAGHSNRTSAAGTKSTSERTSSLSDKRASLPPLPPAKPAQNAPRRADVDDETAATYTSYLSQQRVDEERQKSRASEDSAARTASLGRHSLGRQSTGAPPSYIQARHADHSRAVSTASSALSARSVAIHSHALPPRTSSTGQAGRIPPPPPPPPPVPELPAAHQGPVIGENLQRLIADRRSIGSAGTDPTGISTDAQTTATARSQLARASPRPGPPPRRSLPSLPEGRGDQRRPRADSAPVPTQQQLHATPPKIEEEPIVENESRRLKPKKSRRDDEGAVSATESMRSKRRNREERVKARKMRDLQNQRSGRKDSLNNQSGDARTEGEETGYTTGGGGPTGGALSDSGGSMRAAGSTRVTSASIRSARKRGLYRNSFSPIMLVVEQEPTSLMTRTSLVLGQARARPSRVSSVSRSARGTVSPGRSPSPSLPSSDDGEVVPPLLRKRSPPAGVTRRRRESGGPSSISASVRDRESEFERRIGAVERKNTLLETALLAVISQAASESTAQGMAIQSPLERVVSAIGRSASPNNDL